MLAGPMLVLWVCLGVALVAGAARSSNETHGIRQKTIVLMGVLVVSGLLANVLLITL